MRKTIAGILLIIFCLSMILPLCEVRAFSGELDPENYITLPSMIYIRDGIGTGSISISSSASGYTLSYQKVDIEDSTYNAIQSKSEEYQNYITTSNQTLKEKEANVKTLQTEYENLQSSGTADPEEITEAQTKYEEAYQDYSDYYDSVIETSESLRNEAYALVPNYTNAWTTTTNDSNNVQLDFKNYSGRTNFVLWVRITNGDNTYYDMNIYSSNIENEETVTINRSSANIEVDETLQLTATSSTDANITWTSSDTSIATVSADGLVTGIKEGTVVITAKGSEKTATCTITVRAKGENTDNTDPEGDWTDFSNAKIELKKEGVSEAKVEISNVIPKDRSYYYAFISSNNSKPDIANVDISQIGEVVSYNEETKKFQILGLEKYVELNQEIYISIVEGNENGQNVVLSGQKLERYEEPKYSNAFHATFMTNTGDQIVTTFTHAEENERKLQIKVGKITDTSILQKIKNQDASGFSDLLSLAKNSNDSIYNEIVEADRNMFLQYNAGDVAAATNQNAIDLNELENEAYYFLYVETDDEDGKYITQEAVTLARADVHENGNWYLFFYGSSDFEWADFENVNDNADKDNTTAPGTLPQTGINTVIFITIGLVIIAIGAFSYIQYRRNNF